MGNENCYLRHLCIKIFACITDTFNARSLSNVKRSLFAKRDQSDKRWPLTRQQVRNHMHFLLAFLHYINTSANSRRLTPFSFMAPPPSKKPASFVRITTKSYHNHSSTKYNANTIQRDVAKDTLGLSIGPMPPPEFLDRYLPKTRHLSRKVRKDIFQGVTSDDTDGRPEATMCKAFVSYCSHYSLSLC